MKKIFGIYRKGKEFKSFYQRYQYYLYGISQIYTGFIIFFSFGELSSTISASKLRKMLLDDIKTQKENNNANTK